MVTHINTVYPDFYERSLAHQRLLGAEGAARLLDAGRVWHLAPTLQAGGAIIFPHATLSVCGHQITAAVHACLDSRASQVLALGVLHALTPQLQEARARVAQGADPAQESSWGIQGPDVEGDGDGRQDWRREFSLLHFSWLLQQEAARRAIVPPTLYLRYPFLAAGNPERLPGMAELEALVAHGAVVVATIDPFHHGIGYRDTHEIARYPDQGGLELARAHITEGLELLQSGDYTAYQHQCIATRSDGRDVGQTLHHLLGPLNGEILDLIADDMTEPYQQPAPTWVAGALIRLTR